MFKLKIILYINSTGTISLIIASVLNILLSLRIINVIKIESEIAIGLFIVSFFLELIGILIIIFFLLLVINANILSSTQKIIIISPILVGIIFNIIYLIRLFYYWCFAPILTFLGIPFLLTSCIFFIFKTKKLK